MIFDSSCDPAGNLDHQLTPWRATGYEYDANSQLTTVHLEYSKSIRITRDAAGRPIERHLPGGVYPNVA